MGGGESRARGSQAGLGEARERLGGEARGSRELGSLSWSQLINMCVRPSPPPPPGRPLTPLTRWLAAPLPVQAKY